MKRICADCKADMGDKEPLDDLRVTHGICKSCQEKVEAEYQRVTGRKLREEGEE